MPFALVFIGLIMIVTGARDTYKQFGALVAGDFTGEGNFIYWIAAIGAVGVIGYSETAKPFSRAFMALILVAMVISNKGFAQKLMEAIGSRTTATAYQPSTSATNSTGATNVASNAPASDDGTGSSIDASKIVDTAIKLLPILL